MKILSNYKDFYDYLSCPTDRVFKRIQSYSEFDKSKEHDIPSTTPRFPDFVFDISSSIGVHEFLEFGILNILGNTRPIMVKVRNNVIKIIDGWDLELFKSRFYGGRERGLLWETINMVMQRNISKTIKQSNEMFEFYNTQNIPIPWFVTFLPVRAGLSQYVWRLPPLKLFVDVVGGSTCFNNVELLMQQIEQFLWKDCDVKSKPVPNAVKVLSHGFDEKSFRKDKKQS